MTLIHRVTVCAARPPPFVGSTGNPGLAYAVVPRRCGSPQRILRCSRLTREAGSNSSGATHASSCQAECWQLQRLRCDNFWRTVFFAPQFWSSAVVVWSQMRRPRDSAMSALATVAGGRPERALAAAVCVGPSRQQKTSVRSPDSSCHVKRPAKCHQPVDRGAHPCFRFRRSSGHTEQSAYCASDVRAR